MSYIISETGKEILADVENFCTRNVIKESIKWDKDGKMPDNVRGQVLEFGYQTLTIPEEYGGLGIGALDIAAVLEKIAEADAGLAVMLAGNNLAIKTVLSGGTEEQKERVCSIIAEGGLGAFCLTESQAGSDASAIKTKAVLQDNGDYVINGSKMFITNGSTADVYCIAAVIEGQEKPSVFIVDKNNPGLKHGLEEDKLGIRSCDTCQVILENCRVGTDSLLGGSKGAGCGLKSLLAALNEGRLYVSAMATGVAQRAIDEAVSYAKERVQFGKAISENQAIRFKLADMKIKIEAARQLTAYGLTLMDKGEDFQEAASMAKAFAADTVIEVTSSAMDIFGGYGFVKEYPIEKLLRDARVFQIIEGTGEMQRIAVANALLGKERR